MDERREQSQWQPWLEQHGPRLLLFARQQTRSEADAQDLVQEAILEAARRKANGMPPPPALVFATIRRRAIDLARGESRRASRERAALEPVASESWFDSSIEDQEQARLVQQALERLPEIYRAVITLKLWGELTFAQIAGTLGIPPNTAASRYRYALEQLRKLMKEVLI